MGRPVTRRLTMRFVLRTLQRLQMRKRLNDKLIAEALAKAGYNLSELEFLSNFLEGVHYYAGSPHDYDQHPNRNCPQCGEKIIRDHNGAKYCSNRCKQRAYRLRLNVNGSQRTVTN